ncbi:MAG: NAD(P)-dependent oxidoreductase [Verrucomicrobiales bacterium]
MKILVIGGAGYVGSTVSRDLWENGHDVTALDLMSFGGESLVSLYGKERFRLERGDMRDRARLAEVMPGHDAVVVLAAVVGEPACNRDPETAVSTNLDGTLTALAVAKECGVRHFAFASTCSNYGVADGDDFVTEDAPLQPLSTYSETKVAAEKEILASATEDFFPTVLRLSTAFGVSTRMRYDLLVSDFTLAAVQDGKILIFGEQFWRPFVHVQDIAQAFRLVLEADPETVSGEVFNVGSNDNNTQKIELGRKVKEQVVGTELEFVKKDTDPRSYRVDFSKIRDRLGFEAKWSIEDGIRELHAALEAGVWPDPSDGRYKN